MYKQLEILNKVNHKNSSVKKVENFSYAKNLMSAPITAQEFFEACKCYPIFFAKDSKNNWFATAILGHKDDVNVFVDENGVWEKFNYIPAFVRRYPFVFVEHEVEEKTDLLVAVDKDFLSEDDENGRKIFTEDGENSEYLNGVLNFLNQFNLDSQATSDFIKQLEEWELLEEKIATIEKDKEKFNINGFFVVNEEKLKNLSKKRKEEICNKNVSSLITAHLISLSNIQKLAK